MIYDYDLKIKEIIVGERKYLNKTYSINLDSVTMNGDKMQELCRVYSIKYTFDLHFDNGSIAHNQECTWHVIVSMYDTGALNIKDAIVCNNNSFLSREIRLFMIEKCDIIQRCGRVLQDWWYADTDYRELRNSYNELLEHSYIFPVGCSCLPELEKAIQSMKKCLSTFGIGYVYLIKGIGFDIPHYKIGKSRELKQRINQLEVKLPFEIDVEHIIECGYYSKSEKELHNTYKDKRIIGTEWFTLSNQDVIDIKKINYMNTRNEQYEDWSLFR